MDSHSRSASPREPMRPQHKPPSPPSSPTGFDNRAYTHDEADPNHNDSFASNGGQQNGHTKEPNGVPDAKTLEAVNLELINLTPKNGNAKKKDVEVDMNAANPYDEYFVPVNEHRKYMRGEKLYVTADKRGEKGGCKRPLCWTLLGLIVAAIVAIIVLAATGILFSNSPTPLEQYNTSIITARALGGGSGHLHHDHSEHDHSEHDHSQHDHSEHGNQEMDHNTEPSEQHGPEAKNDEVSSSENPITEETSSSNNMYVPRTVEGELKVDNEEFTAALQDPESNEYREFVTTFSDALKRAVFDRNSIENGDNEITVEVIQLREGSVIVTYRVHWRPRSHAENTEDLLNASKLKTNLNEYLNKNNRMINIYHIADDNIVSKPVVDVCQINKNGCEYECEFDDRTLDFTCTCPRGQIIDIANPKKCMSLLGNTENEQTNNKESAEENVTENIQQIAKTNFDEENATSRSEHSIEQTFDWQESHHAMPETTTEAETVNFSHIFSQPTEKTVEDESHKTESIVEATPEPSIASHPEPSPEPEPTMEIKPEPEPEPTAEPAAGSSKNAEAAVEAEPQPQSELEPTAEPEARAELESEMASQPKLEQEPQSEPEPEPVGEPTPAPEPEPESKAEPTPTPEPEPESKVEPEPVPEPESKIEMEPESETKDESESEPETKVEPEPEPEPKVEPEPEPKVEPETGSESQDELEPELEVKAEPEYERKTESKEETTTPFTEPKFVNPTFISPEEPQSGVVTESKSVKSEHGLSEVMQTPESKTETMPSTTESHQTTTEQVELVSITDEPKLSSTMKLDDKSNNNEEKSILYTNEGKFEYHLNKQPETTTLRVSISEPNIINEPSYEPKPEIISILSNDKETSKQTTTMAGEAITTTESNDWLEEEGHNGLKSLGEPDQQNYTNNAVYADILSNNIKKITEQSEQRSFKSFNDDEFTFETTTTTSKTNEMNDSNMLLDFINKDNTAPEPNESETTEKVYEDNIIPVLKSATMDNDAFETETTKPMLEPTSSTATSEVSNSESNNSNEREVVVDKNMEEKADIEKSIITSPLDEANLLDTNKSEIIITSTAKPESTSEFSIGEHQNSSEEKLMEILDNKPTTTASTNDFSTERETEEGMDVTFDSINMLYNRSSKSIDNQSSPAIQHNNNQTKITDSITEIITQANDVITSTESDWLEEPVTEMNYNDAMNKMDKQDTTETTVKTFEDIMPQGLEKDDFVPDYLSNMGSSGNKQDDEPLYGMNNDYDNEDNRFKRVNNETLNVTKNNSSEENMNHENTGTTNGIPIMNIPLETTTVSEYIYNMAKKANEEPEVMLVQHNETEPTPSSSPALIAAPAPVWEDSETDKDAAVNTNNQSSIQLTSNEMGQINNTVTAQDHLEIPISMENVTPNNTTQVTENIEGPIETKTEVPNNSSQNTTRLNNLNVTIYEIPSHSSNNSMSKTSSSQSAEYDDHEPEMNPFLPDIENNKILVKKLQEGHDLEPVTLNETQNENTEEHTVALVEGQVKNAAPTVSTATLDSKEQDNDIKTTTEGDTLNELVNENSHENVTHIHNNQNNTADDNKTNKTSAKETLPVSTFLLDTDDLVTPSTKLNSNNILIEGASTTTSSAISSGDSEYLSVVPITEEKEELLKLHKNQNIEALNDITDLSDSSKSVKRTLDGTQIDSETTNEA